MKTAREEVARDAVEGIEVAEASLDHGEQMLAIARQKALRVASIEAWRNCSVSSRRASVWSSSGWAMRWISTRPWSPPTVTQHAHADNDCE